MKGASPKTVRQYCLMRLILFDQLVCCQQVQKFKIRMPSLQTKIFTIFLSIDQLYSIEPINYHCVNRFYYQQMGRREIKKTVVQYQSQQPKPEPIREKSRSRSRERPQPKPQVKVEELNITDRRARLLAMRKARQEEEEVQIMGSTNKQPQISVKLEEPMISEKPIISKAETAPKQQRQQSSESESQEEQEQDNSEKQGRKVLMKPVFINKVYRQDDGADEEHLKQEQRKRKNNRYTTKLLLEQSKYQDSEEENENTDSDQENQTAIPDDDDTKNEEYEFQLWKIRELKRIRRAQDERRKHDIEKAEMDRRRVMSNEQILIENRALGSDATDNDTQTKYVFMQKYYHRGAFYQDNDDEVFKRDYNLPTPMQMQDKSMLPKLLQKRIGNFGKKGQSKYTHLTAEDTSDLNPLTRADESLLEYWKKRTAGYKGAGSKL